MTTDYQEGDVLEHTGTGQRLKILRVRGVKIRVRNLTDGVQRDYGEATFRRSFANLTAQEQGRYQLPQWEPAPTRCSA